MRKLSYYSVNMFSVNVFKRVFPSIRDLVVIKVKPKQIGTVGSQFYRSDIRDFVVIKFKMSQFGTRQHFRQFYRPSIRDMVAIEVNVSQS